MAYDLVIRNGVVIDGTGSPGFEADVAVEGDRIAAIGKSLGRGSTEIDARGSVVSPGFIDAHTHMDLFLLLYPHGNPVVNFGVTTVVIGDCGASCAPVPDGEGPRAVLINYLKRVLDNYVDDKLWTWKTFPEYLAHLNGRIGINAAALVPHSPVRLSVMGEAAYEREATAEELAAMKQVVREGMEGGAIGFSSSPRGGPAVHAGTPSTFATHDEIVELANVAGELNGVFQFNAFYNMIKPSTGFPAMLDRINARMIGNEFRLHPGETEQGPQALEYMAEMARKGKDVTGVVIPYQHIRRFDASGAFLFNGLPSWESVKGSPEALKRACADPAFRSRLELERNTDAGQPEHHTWTGWSGLVFERLDNPALGQLENKSVEQIALETGKNPADAFFDTWLADDLRSGLLYYGLANDRLDVLEDMITSPYGLIGTDAGAHLDRFFWHGTPARLLGYWCREKNLLGLEEAVWKLTGMPAQKLAINRGRLAVGWPADVTVFDPDRIRDLVSDRLPQKVDAQEVNRHPAGVGAVIVNGQVAVQDGECMDVYAGRSRRADLSPSVPEQGAGR